MKMGHVPQISTLATSQLFGFLGPLRALLAAMGRSHGSLPLGGPGAVAKAARPVDGQHQGRAAQKHRGPRVAADEAPPLASDSLDREQIERAALLTKMLRKKEAVETKCPVPRIQRPAKIVPGETNKNILNSFPRKKEHT